jgi:hypothetical protein
MELNKVYNGHIKGFRYNAEWAFVTISTDSDASASLIIGSKQDYPMSELIQLKQCSSIDYRYLGDKKVNDKDYPRLRIESINF